MAYYQLRCSGCKETFEPLCATEEEELLSPDFDDVRERLGQSSILTDMFEAFYKKHAGHGLNVILC